MAVDYQSCFLAIFIQKPKVNWVCLAFYIHVIEHEMMEEFTFVTFLHSNIEFFPLICHPLYVVPLYVCKNGSMYVVIYMW